MKNIDLSQRVIQSLLDAGVEEFCLCAGARNSPFVVLFDENPHLKVYHFFEERSAGFFALGRILATRKPVAVITTSGTASAELLPSAIEGTYSSLPLIMITADRPRSYRKTGAPQSIEQVGLYSYYIEVAYDLDESNTHFSLKNLSWKKPIHVNVCFEEPLLDGDVPQLVVPQEPYRHLFPESHPRSLLDEIEQFLGAHRPLVLVSTLPRKYVDSVKSFLKTLSAPVYLEGISQLRGVDELEPIAIRGGENTLHELLEKNVCDSVLRLGGVPTVRVWRDLEDRYREIPVLSLGFNHFQGLSRKIHHFSALDVLDQIEVPRGRSDSSVSWKPADQFRSKKLIDLFNQHPRSEASLISELSKKLNQKSIYLGNSLPLRDWDLAASFDVLPLRVTGNRGANGIDGQISTFFGWCKEDHDNWGILGDLTALYDLSGPWVTQFMNETSWKLVIINNLGGQIFQKMFDRSIFLNQHNIDFEPWAKMWKLPYHRWFEVPRDFSNLEQRCIIELKPDPEQSRALNKLLLGL